MMQHEKRRILQGVVAAGTLSLGVSLLAAEPGRLVDPPPLDWLEIDHPEHGVPVNVGAPERVGEWVYYRGYEYGVKSQLYRTDNTEAGVQRLTEVNTLSNGLRARELTAWGDQLLFRGKNERDDWVLWQAEPDGTAAPLTGGYQSEAVPNAREPRQITSLGNKAYFAADGDNFRELWRTDGTVAGTTEVANLMMNGSSNPRNLTSYQDRLLFWANAGDFGNELWTSDGSESGTRMVKDLDPGYSGLAPRPMTPWRGRVYFSRSEGRGTGELWATDGTGEGTHRVIEIVPGTGSADPARMTPSGDKLFFAANTADGRRTLFTTDGTAAGTAAVTTDASTPSLVDPRSLTAVRDQLFFVADDAAGQQTLWVSDGTGSGTQPTAFDLPGQVRTLAEADGYLFFKTWNDVQGREYEDLWITDGTADGTHHLYQAPGWGNIGELDSLTVWNDRAVFTLATRSGSSNHATGSRLASVTLPPVPEPASLTLLGVSGLMLFGRRRRLREIG